MWSLNIRARGGTGIRVRLRSVWGNPWEFESPRAHNEQRRQLEVLFFITHSMFADIGFGVLAAVLISTLFSVELSASIIAAGIFFALLPDIDFLVELIRHGSVGGRVEREHRNLLHHPLTYIPVAVAIYFTSGSVWATLFTVCVLFHFMHDSFGIGWGIKWLWPFLKNNYKIEKVGGTYYVVSRTPEELERVVAERGDPEWIRNIYLRPSKVALIEFLIFLVCGIVLLVTLMR